MGKAKKAPKLTKARSAKQAADDSDVEPDTVDALVDARVDGGERDEEDPEEAEDDTPSSSSSNCKHAKCIKPTCVRGQLKNMAKEVDVKRAALKGKSAAEESLWLCSACGQLDAAASHFNKKCAVGLDLLTQSWRCFPCDRPLPESSVDQKSLVKMRLVGGLVEGALGRSATKQAKEATSNAIRSSKEAVALAAQQEAHAASVAAASAAASAALAHPGPIVKGLQNLGNTCFFNSVMQCIAATTPLYGMLLYPSSSLYDDRAISLAYPSPLQHALRKFLETMQQPPKIAPPPPPSTGKKQKYAAPPRDDSRVVDPRALLSAVQSLNPMFRGGRQHDSHELLRTVLNGICTEKEEEARKKRQAVTASIVRQWTQEQVLKWVASFGMSQGEQLATNIMCDQEHAWDGAFVLWLLDNYNAKAAKKPRIILHHGITSVEDKRILFQQLQRLKDGNLPSSMSSSNGAADDSSDAAALPQLHPFSSVLDSNFIHRLFGGVARNTVECLACHTRSTTHEFFLDLSLAIEAPRVQMSRQETAARAAAVAAVAKATAAAEDKSKTRASSATSSSSSTPAISKKSPVKAKGKGKHMTKQARKAAKRAQRRHSTSDAAEGEQEEGEEEGSGDEQQEGEEEEQTKETDVAAEAADATAEAASDAEAPKSDPAASSPATAPVSAVDSTVAVGPSAADAPVPVADPPTPAVSATTSTAPDAVAEMTHDVAALSISESASASAAEPPAVVNAAPAGAAASTADTVVAASEGANGASSSTASASSSSSSVASVPPVPSSASAASAFLSYARQHRLGMARLGTGRQAGVSLADCLGAFTDPDLLTGSNKYGCRECSRRAQEAAAAAQVQAQAAIPPVPSSDEAPVPSPAAAPDALESNSSASAPADSPLSPTAAASVDSSSPPVDANANANPDAAASAPNDNSAPTSADNSVDPAADSTPAWDAEPAGDAVAESPDANGDTTAATSAAAADPPLDDDSIPAAAPPPPPVWVKQDALKRSRILVPPTVLTLHLKRFHQHGRHLEKNDKEVTFPLCINLADYMAAPVPVEPSPEGGGSQWGGDGLPPSLDGTGEERAPDCWYHLYGIVSHGGGMGGGHYVSYMRKDHVAAACSRDSSPPSHAHSPCQPDAPDLSDSWFYASDSTVRPVTTKEVLRAQAYLLFYVKA